MLTTEGDLDVFLLALFLFFAVVIVPAMAVVLSAWLTDGRRIRR